MRIAVVGASGFMGAAISRALEQEHSKVVTVRGPRISTEIRDIQNLLSEADSSFEVAVLADEFANVDVVINTAGVSNASTRASDILYGANAVLPRVVLRAAEVAGVKRLVHISSAAVQGGQRTLDSSEN